MLRVCVCVATAVPKLVRVCVCVWRQRSQSSCMVLRVCVRGSEEIERECAGTVIRDKRFELVSLEEGCVCVCARVCARVCVCVLICLSDNVL